MQYSVFGNLVGKRSREGDSVHIKYIGPPNKLPGSAEIEAWASRCGSARNTPADHLPRVAGIVYHTLAYLLSNLRVEVTLPGYLSEDSLRYIFAEVSDLAKIDWDPNLPYFAGQVRAALEDPQVLREGVEYALILTTEPPMTMKAAS